MIVRRADAETHFLLRLAVTGALSLVVSAASADEARLYDIGGGFLAGAQLEAGAVYTNNYFYEANNGLSATGYRIQPEVSLQRRGSFVDASFGANLKQTSFDLPGSLDEYLDYGANGKLGWRPWAKQAFDLSGSFARGHDQPGLQRTETGGALLSSRDVDEWESSRVGLGYSYGSPSSSASNDLGVSFRKKEYVTNRADTQSLNYSGVSLSYLLTYAYSPRTALLFAVGHNSTDYEVSRLPSGNSRNGDELLLRTGLRWVASGKTSGSVLVGARSYSSEGRTKPSREGLSWRANVDWAASDTTTLRLTTSQNTTETFRFDTEYIDDRSVDLSWRQVWTQRLNTTLKAGYTNSEFVGTGRTDDIFDLSASAGYRLMRTVSLFGDYNYSKRESTEDPRAYTAPQISAGVRWTP